MENTVQILLLLADALLTFLIGYVGYKIKKHAENKIEQHKKEESLRNLLRLVTKLMLSQQCDYYIKKGSAPYYIMGYVEEIYKEYHALGGNGVIAEMYEEFMKLPHTEVKKGEKI